MKWRVCAGVCLGGCCVSGYGDDGGVLGLVVSFLLQRVLVHLMDKVALSISLVRKYYERIESKQLYQEEAQQRTNSEISNEEKRTVINEGAN